MENTPIYSAIVFYGDCELKNVHQIPNEAKVIYSGGVANFVKYVCSGEEVNYADIDTIRATLKESVDNGNNAEVRYRHAMNIQDNII